MPRCMFDADCMWCIIFKYIHAFVQKARPHDSFGTHGAELACHLQNIFTSAGKQSVSHQIASQQDDTHIKLWGCLCWYALPPHEHKCQVSPHAVLAVHLGSDTTIIVYSVWDLCTCSVSLLLAILYFKILTFDDDGESY